MLKQGLLERGGHSPNQGALATRKVCQNDELAARLPPLTRPWPGHISARSRPWRWRLFCCGFGRWTQTCSIPTHMADDPRRPGYWLHEASRW